MAKALRSGRPKRAARTTTALLDRDHYTILGVVDRIHREIGYAGGRLALADVFDFALPGVLLAPSRTLPDGTQAAMMVRGGCVAITFDETLPKDVQRLAIAHEVGHAIFHEGRWGGPVLAKRTEPRVEQQAETFAVELLAPLWAIAAARHAGERAEWAVPRLAAEFEVPAHVAARRVSVIEALGGFGWE